MYVAPPPPMVDPVSGLPLPTTATGAPAEDPHEHLYDFCEEVIDELTKYGPLLEFHLMANLGEHMLGNVYIKYADDESAERALKALNGRYYCGRALTCEYSPVSDFRESRCRSYDEDGCTRRDFCNFMHVKKLPSRINRMLDRIRDKSIRTMERRGRDHRDRSRSPPNRDRHYHRHHHGSSRDREYDRDKHRSRERDGSRSDPPQPSPSSSSASAEASSSSSSHQRSESEERRAKIAAWNRAREEKKEPSS